MLNNTVSCNEAGATQTGRQARELLLMRGNYLTKMKPAETVYVWVGQDEDTDFLNCITTIFHFLLLFYFTA